MKKYFQSILITLLAITVSAQKKASLHSPAEILKIMTDSKVQYDLTRIEKTYPSPDRSTNLNYNDVYRIHTAAGFSTVRFKAGAELQQALNRGEDAFQKKNYDDARKNYLDVLRLDSTYYMVLAYIGQTYRLQQNWPKAIEWYEKAIRLNYIDYMAHWFLANAYESTGRLEEAKREILIAHILNRNNPRVMVALREILKENNLRLEEWQFLPQYSISKGADDKVKIEYGPGWLFYSLVKAIWTFEPGYRKAMGYEDDNIFPESEEKEALIGMLLSEDEETKALPATKALQKATEDSKNNLLQEFIFYEILLPERPLAAYQFPEELINSIADYIIKVRCGKIN